MKKINVIFAIFAMLVIGAGCRSNQENKLTLSGLNPADFETEVGGLPVKLYQLTNSNGMEACVTNYGGRIVSLMVPNREGKMIDVVLGYDSIADYLNNDGNFGALIGRYGNRINQGRFMLDSVEYQLPQNNYNHCLHGGPVGFHNRVWHAFQSGDNSLKLTLNSKDGEDGFPGNIKVTVTYTLTDDNALDIQYEAETDKKTILNLTNHSYFNLSGDPSTDILDHVLWFDANGYTPIDSTFMTTGEIAPVEGTPFDFRTPKSIGKEIEADNEQLKNGKGYDHNMVLNHPGDLNIKAARLVSPKSGVVMSVYTTEPGIQFYAGNFLDGTNIGKKGKVYGKRNAVCLETQHFPDSPNKPQWPSVVVGPKETYKSRCIYKFAVGE